MTVAFITHPHCRLHAMEPWHPESPERLSAIDDQLLASGVDLALRHFEAPRAGIDDLLRVHSAEYVDWVQGQVPAEGLRRLDPDTAMNPHSLDAALRAAGAAVLAVDLVLGGDADRAFCAVRPPGHHAERGRAMGFCIFNNIAVGAGRALAGGAIERLAICDFDVHHGNGTEDIFRGDERVLFCSAYQHPFYPHSDPLDAAPNAVHLPLEAGSGGEDFRAGIEAEWLPRLDAFAPQLVLISAGFDAHAEDDMSSLRLTEPDYTWVTERLVEIADRSAGGRIVSTLEGGYALSALGRSVAAHLKALLG
jgi:acetoin utilization deacetylase AcuC-like enzyme